jgi:ATP:corrinoid adenosyltransferase
VREDEVLECLSRKPQSVHVVITGRDASASLIAAADIVTEMKEVKHSFTAGVKAQQGIEW